MSNYTGLLPNYRFVGQNVLLDRWGGGNGWSLSPFYPGAGRYPAIADSYLPPYGNPQTRYGSCVCYGGALAQNSCSFQNGYRPQCVKMLGGGQSCRCSNATGEDWGCFSRPGFNCV